MDFGLPTFNFHILISLLLVLTCLIPIPAKAQNKVDFELESPSSISAGQSFEVDLKVNTHGEEVSIVETYLTFSSNLEYKKADWNEELAIVSNGGNSRIVEGGALYLQADATTDTGELFSTDGFETLVTLTFEETSQTPGEASLEFKNGTSTKVAIRDKEPSFENVDVGTGLSIVVSKIRRLPNPLKAETISEFIQYLINLLFYIALALAPLMFIIGGYYYLTAAGDPDRIKTGRNILIYTGAGIGIMLLAKVLISMIIAALGG